MGAEIFKMSLKNKNEGFDQKKKRRPDQKIQRD